MRGRGGEGRDVDVAGGVEDDGLYVVLGDVLRGFKGGEVRQGDILNSVDCCERGLGDILLAFDRT